MKNRKAHRGHRSSLGTQKQIVKFGQPPYSQNLSLTLASKGTYPKLDFDYSDRFAVVKAVSSCCICGFSNIYALEIHHIDSNHKNNSWDNIAVVCSNCHTLLTKRKLNFWDVRTQRK